VIESPIVQRPIWGHAVQINAGEKGTIFGSFGKPRICWAPASIRRKTGCCE